MAVAHVPLIAAAMPMVAGATETPNLQALSIEELAQVPVRSASKRDEPLSTAPTSLYVITGEDVLNSGATSLPELLRLAPNLDVQQVDASQYAITARGFNGTETANKLLVLMDGRSIYTPLQSQVFWNLHSPLVQDLQQIEVISGPGGTLYGPNAVNGVVNITSRDAHDTLGTLVRGTGGAYERTAGARYGTALGSLGAIRVYGDYHDREALPTGTGFAGDDAFRGWQVGFRGDVVSESDHLTLQGDWFRNKAESVTGDGNRGFNLLGRWQHTLSTDTSVELQAYYDKFRRDFILVRDSLETIDVEAQMNVTKGIHNLVAGAGLRTTRDKFINNLNIFQLDPTSKRLWIGNAFVQDRIDLGRGISVIPGIKVERSTFTGWQALPSVRLAWQASNRDLWWSAISRAIRTPSRIDRGLSAPPLLTPATNFKTEKLVALEAGYRGQPTAFATLSVTAFHNWYEDIRTTESSLGGVLPIQLSNGIKGRSWGIEGWSTVQLASNWRLTVGGTRLWKDFSVRKGRTDLANLAAIGDDPKWQLKAGTDLDLGRKVQLSVDGRWSGAIETAPRIPSYVEASGRIGWTVTDAVELFVQGRNLLHATHLESNDLNQGQRPQRSIVAGSRLRF
ncbi:TonB-dependent receptor [Sphingomonas sp. BN140010]|uniref:TonB-dependent receptor n=1 Tax=Sphingomonas arvum TaxID=2992113 RepID=A0ABT3JC76_9SPHN|nr:TonB-dependent receptor [Sphingomonas sp. BN140010]MCW3796519.1 TonB-dependent receptor [Sphingomonas sp. BN140010]